jgi:hypothetical protein
MSITSVFETCLGEDRSILVRGALSPWLDARSATPVGCHAIDLHLGC